MDNSVIAKSGWLFRQTSILKKWKKNWVELYRDGHLKYYESDQSPNADDVIFMPSDCLAVRTGSQVEGVQPPEGFSAQCIFSVVSTTGKTWIFCGENVDDMRAWQLALEQARLSRVPSNAVSGPTQFMHYSQPSSSQGGVQYVPQYGCPQNYYTGPLQGGYVVGQPQQPTTVIYQQQPPYYSPYYYHPGTDMAMGMMAGAAMGSMMWSPMFWW